MNQRHTTHDSLKLRTSAIVPGIFSVGISLLLLAATGCGDKKDKGDKKGGIKDYAVLTLSPRNTTIFYDFPATAQGEQVVEIRPKVDGYVEQIYVSEGANVKKGQLLFKLSNPQYEQSVITAKASIKSAIADVNAAQMDVEKVRPLVEKGIVSKYELESAQYTLQAKEAALAQAQATLVNAQTNLGYTELRSPEDGVIGTIPYKVGALITSTTASPLTTLSNTRNIYAYYSMNEKQLLGFSAHLPGNTLQEKLTHLPPAILLLADGTQYDQPGKIETASGLITTETGSATFKATFPNPLGIIRTGASAIVRIPRPEDSVLLVPQTASYEVQDKQFVYKLVDGNRIRSTAITSTPTSDGQFLIVRSGLQTGDKVVINGFNLKDSTVIKPRPVNADSLYSKPQVRN